MSDELTADELAELKTRYAKLYTHPIARLISDHERLLAVVRRCGNETLLTDAAAHIKWLHSCIEDEITPAEAISHDMILDRIAAALEPGENSPQPPEQP